jgi:F-type H+-transporting ATPase subunit gamma
MPSLKSIRKRISSVKNTQKITRAMKMVAGARLTRAQQRITSLRPYAVKTGEVLRNVVSAELAADAEVDQKPELGQDPLHPLLVVRPEKKVLFLVLSSDRGLCGGFNANISKAVERAIKEKAAAGCEVSCAFVGRKARDYLMRRGATSVQNFEKFMDGLELSKVALITDWFVPRFRKGEYDAVYLAYNEFKSAMTQKPVVELLLPVSATAGTVKSEGQSESQADTSTSAGAKDTTSRQFEFEPDRDGLLDKLVPMYVNIAVYRALLESQASEFGARMSAMDAATRNAKQMIGKLTLVYNRARQAGITKELMEIVGGAEALKD